MEHCLHQTTEEPMVNEPIRPELKRFTYVAMLLGSAAAAPLAYPATATAEPQGNELAS